jgi:hypothetical protein
MADTKITALAAITTVDPAADVLPIVDISDTSMAASGTTKKITSNQILGAGGTATLASATITGDLTVRTTGLTVNSSGVGVGLTAALGAGNIQIGAGKYLGYSATAYITPEDNVQGARIKADNILIDGNTSTKWNIGGSESMRLNSTGLGVGVSPSTRLHISNSGDVYARIATTSVSKAGVQLSANGVVRSHLLYDNGAGTTYLSSGTGFGGSGQALVLQSGTSLVFYTNNQLATANMTLDASGNLLVARTGAGLDNTSGVTIGQASIGMQTEGNATQIVVNRTTSDGTVIDIRRNNVSVGSIAVTTTATAYNQSSDYRLKESAQPLVGGLSRVNALKPSVYKWKVNGSAGEGFLAHELAEVVPFAVTGDKDAVDADGKPTYQGVDLSKIVPILVAAIQELTARVQTIEAR